MRRGLFGPVPRLLLPGEESGEERLLAEFHLFYKSRSAHAYDGPCSSLRGFCELADILVIEL